jgi:creatinine amidohydrolase
MPNNYKLAEMTFQQIADYLKTNDRIILPIGSTEQHGPISILGTDHLCAEAVAKRVSQKTGTMMAPTLPFGMSEHHLAFPGTISFSKETYYLVLYNILSKIYRHGFRRIILINGHGGNRRTVNAVRFQLKNECPGISIILMNWYGIPTVKQYLKKHFGDDEGDHATPGETSIMMSEYPKSVKKRKVPKGDYPPREDYEKAKLPEDFKRIFPSGVWYADPNLATAAHGKKLIDLSVKYIVPKMKNWEFEE